MRKHCDRLRAVLWTQRASFDSHWGDLSRNILPRRVRFTTSENNKGDKRNQNIIDSTATEAAGTCAAGMHSGITSPSRPWFKLALGDKNLMEEPEVKEYLHAVEERMQQLMVLSNFYGVLPVVYADMCVFATGAFAIMEDPETAFRCYDFPLGTFAVANDARREVSTFARQYQLTVDNLVELYGNLDEHGKADFQRGEPTNLSVTVQNLWTRGEYTAWVDVCEVIRPNRAYDGQKMESRYKKYEQIVYEMGTSAGGHKDGDAGVLAHAGFDEFPIMVGRWDKGGEDVYGTSCPGMVALGDIKQLQLMERRTAQGYEKMINPPLTAPPELMNAKVSVLPGDITYAATREGQQGLRPTYQVDFDIAKAEAKMDRLRDKIERAFKVHLFAMLSQSDRRDITAREVDELHEEKLLGLGPLLERVNDDILDRSINRIFAICERAGQFPEPPDVLQGMRLTIEYVSWAATAQKLVGVQSLERTAAFVGQVAQFSPDALDVIDIDELVREHADATGAPPKVTRTEEDVAAIRQQRAQAQQMQQAAENLPSMASAAADLGNTPADPNSILGKLLGGQNAKATLRATSQPMVQ